MQETGYENRAAIFSVLQQDRNGKFLTRISDKKRRKPQCQRPEVWPTWDLQNHKSDRECRALGSRPGIPTQWARLGPRGPAFPISQGMWLQVFRADIFQELYH